MRSKRSIACANDGGRCIFEQSGKPYIFEDTYQYEDKRISKRFTPELLDKYVSEIAGINPFSDAAYCDENGQIRGALIEKCGDLPKTIRYVSLNEARQAIGLEG